ncbi:MAG TPA: type II toxin-antitoxin system Phd/YefM family antitoxin [Longimicrobiaceae bacterium]|jgi:prevent-host-death family protein|nr:type II toxin-antitoxin system Phd/YefM family antitoxin [Longimicrobiaceae bacterium]
MRRPNLSEDVQPVSEFRANAAKFVQRVRETRRPLVLTQHGKSAAVLLDVDEYERMVDTIELLRAVQQGEAELDAGLGVPHEEAMAQLLEKYKGR